MDIATFFTNIQERSFLERFSVVQFCSPQYPLLFFSALFERVKKRTDVLVRFFDFDAQSDVEIAMAFQTTFLGMRGVYWLGDIDTLDGARKKKWVTFLMHYTGPHTLIFYSTVALESMINGITISVAEGIDKKTAVALLNIDNYEEARLCIPVLEALYARLTVVTLDQVYVCMRYARLAGRNKQVFINEWLGLLVYSEKSLFTLSQYFFAKDDKKFFALWSVIRKEYSTVFWILFWSEQLFRASCYVQCMKQRKHADAKKISFRLPFSFIQRDWSLHTYGQLRDAHAAIYSIDCNVKNGADEGSLDLFYSKFFV
ncbi:MAG TPA: hypothetical protein VGT41_05440 [Candidatus Babeliales bacterium]|nr:hypothetical protein [Candidatus Babeliales bacterium]